MSGQLAYAGGGGSSSGGGGFSGGGSYSTYTGSSSDSGSDTSINAGGVIVYIVFVVIAIIAIQFFFGSSKSKKTQSKSVKAELAALAQTDPVWSEDTIVTRAKEVFIRYQADWTNRNLEGLSEYMTQSYAQHAQLMMAALRQAKRIDKVENPQISQAVISSLNHQADGSGTVIVYFSARASDSLVDEQTQHALSTNNGTFAEYWRFVREKNQWYLDGIQQVTEAEWARNKALEDFAKTNGYFYSLDWGSLLLPTHGQIFKDTSFTSADINNHVIGLYDKQYILQLYTYSSAPAAQGGKTYIVAQTNIPKDYGEIFVRHKKALFNATPRDLQKISMEWGEFNDKYDVFASNSEGVTSFELLEPVFMEKLEALPFEVNIEVVDNIVYLYAGEQTNVPSEHYQVMLGILQEAYKQMKM